MKFKLKFSILFFLPLILIACTQTIISNPTVTQSTSPKITLNVSAASDLKYALLKI
jgi:ABC-type molybdate transport system substrate-binding protein